MTNMTPSATVPPPPPGSARSADGRGTDERWAAAPWSVLDAVGALVVTVVVVVAATVGLRAAVPADPPPWAAGLLIPVPLVVLAVVTVVWVHVRYSAAGHLAGPVRGRLRDWLGGFAAGIGAFVAVNVVLGLLVQALAALMGVDLPEPQEQLRRLAADPGLAPWVLGSAVLVAPVAEEVYFRGMLFQAVRRRHRALLAIAVSGSVFAVAHVAQEATGAAGLLVFALILPVGFFLGWLFEWRGTLAAPIAAHAGFNLATAAVLFVAASEGLLAAALVR